MSSADEKPRAARRFRDWTPAFLKALASTGIVLYAARLAKVDRTTVYDRRRKDAKFAEDWDEALETALGNAEYELYRRAVYGTKRPVYKGGKKVGEIIKHDTPALIFLLKALRPEKYREPRGNAYVAPKPRPLDPELAAVLGAVIADFRRAEVGEAPPAD